MLLLLLSGCSGTATPSSSADSTQPVATADPGQTSSQDPSSPSTTEDLGEIVKRSVYTVDDLTIDDPRLDQVVATCGDQTMTNRRFQIYYCMQYFNFMNQYGSYAYYFGLDTSKPFSEQASVQEGLTWEQFFAESAVDQFRQFGAVTEKAKAEGFDFSEEERKMLQDSLDDLESSAQAAGYDSADAYIQASFGATVNAEAYKAFMQDYYYIMAYENKLYNSISWTDEDLQEYFENHKENYDGLPTDQTNINVRHILIKAEDMDSDGQTSEDEKAAARTKAQELLETWKENPTEENFAALASEHTADGGSKSSGGLYENVYPGQMVQAFNDWCFDASRQSGDTGIVETEYGFHIMYFVADTGEYQWKIEAQKDYTNDRMVTMLTEITEAYPTEVNYEALILAPLPKPEEE